MRLLLVAVALAYNPLAMQLVDQWLPTACQVVMHKVAPLHSMAGGVAIAAAQPLGMASNGYNRGCLFSPYYNLTQ